MVGADGAVFIVKSVGREHSPTFFGIIRFLTFSVARFDGFLILCVQNSNFNGLSTW